MEIGQAFNFVREDESWIKKLAIGALFVVVPFLIIFLIGYQIRITRNVIDGKERPLPEWEDFGQLFIDGLIIIVAAIIYALPIILISICVAIFSATSTDASGAMSGVATAAVIVLNCLSFLYSIALALIIPALYIQYARTGEFGSLLRFAEIFAIARENLVDFLIIFVVNLVANIVVGIVSVIAVITICGPIIVGLAGTAWIMYATGHLYGQVARKMSDKALAADYSPA